MSSTKALSLPFLIFAWKQEQIYDLAISSTLVPLVPAIFFQRKSHEGRVWSGTITSPWFLQD